MAWKHNLKKTFVNGFKTYSIFSSTDGSDTLGRVAVKKLGTVTTSAER